MTITIKHFTVNCPIGSFFNVVEKICELCPQGSYQSEEAQMACEFLVK